MTLAMASLGDRHHYRGAVYRAIPRCQGQKHLQRLVLTQQRALSPALEPLRYPPHKHWWTITLTQDLSPRPSPKPTLPRSRLKGHLKGRRL
jgi:hypothetical protein